MPKVYKSIAFKVRDYSIYAFWIAQAVVLSLTLPAFIREYPIIKNLSDYPIIQSLSLFVFFLGFISMAVYFWARLIYARPEQKTSRRCFCVRWDPVEKRYAVGNDSLTIYTNEEDEEKEEAIVIPFKSIDHIEMTSKIKIPSKKDDWTLVGFDGYVPFIKQLYLFTNIKDGKSGKRIVYFVDPEKRKEFINEIAAKGVKIICT